MRYLYYGLFVIGAYLVLAMVSLFALLVGPGGQPEKSASAERVPGKELGMASDRNNLKATGSSYLITVQEEEG